MKTLCAYLGVLIVAAIIAVGAAFVMVELTSGQAHAEEGAGVIMKQLITPVPSYYKLIEEEPEAMLDLKFQTGIERFGLTLRGPKSGSSNILAKSLISSQMLPVSNYIDPYLGWERLVSVTSRKVMTIYYKYYAEPLIEQRDILEISPDGTRKLICTLFLHHNLDGIQGDYISQTDLLYTDKDGFQVTLTVGGEIDWDAFYRSISVAEGVYYGKPGKITKVKNEYNANGDRLFGIMKVTYFDSLGSIIREELTKERSWYDKNGKLIKTSTAFSVDGKLVRVSSLNRIYIGKTLLLETKDTINYNQDGTIASSTLERTSFDAKGRETKYTLTGYEAGRKAHTVTRETRYGDSGSVTYYNREDVYYNVDGSSYALYEHTTFDEHTGSYYHSWKSVSYGADGQINNYYAEMNEERYNDAGQLVFKRTFRHEQVRPGWGLFQGQLTTTYEAEDITEYEYDAKGNLIKEYNHGYWFSAYVDPWYKRLTTFIYNQFTGLLMNKHVSRVEAADSAFENVTYRYDEDVHYRYQPTITIENSFSPQPLIRMMVRTVTEERWNADTWNVRSYEKFVTLDSETYDKTGKIIQKSHFRQEQALPRWGPLAGVLTVTYEEERIIDYTYDKFDGNLINEHEHGYWFSTYIDPFFDKLTTWAYEWLPWMTPDSAKKLVNKHVVLKEAQDADYANMIHEYVEDTVYKYDVDSGSLASVHTTISDTYYYDWGMWNRESKIEELYENGNLTIRSVIDDYNNGESGYMELLTYTRYEDGTVETEVSHKEWLYQGVPTSASDEIKTFNRKGQLTLHTIRSDGLEYTETRTYHENGNLASVDIVSYNNGKRYIIDDSIYYKGDIRDDIGRIETAYETKILIEGELIREPISRWQPGYYELHETYNENGLITHREEKTEYNNWWGPWYINYPMDEIYTTNASEKVADSIIRYPWYSSKTTTSLTENWEYSAGDAFATGAVLLHYKKEYSSVTSNNYDWDGLKTGTGVYKETVERFYSESGKILEERYEQNGNNGFSTDYRYDERPGEVIANDVETLKIRPLNAAGDIPQDVNAFVYAVIDNFYSNGVYKNSTQKMNILYHYGDDGSLGSVQINWQAQGSDGSILYGFLSTITVEEGKIMTLVVSETGERNNFWDIPILNIISPYLKYIDGSQPVTDPAIQVQYAENQDAQQGGGGAPQLVAQKACDELVSEFDNRMELVERNMKQRAKNYSPSMASNSTYSTHNR